MENHPSASSEQCSGSSRRKKRKYSVSAGNIICSDDDMSVLPDGIVSYILSFLSMEEAFRTRLVCRSWRDLRVPVLNLKLHPRMIFNSKYKYYTSFADKILLGIPIKDTSGLWEFENEFVRKVDLYLNNFPGKKLVSFNISFCFYFWKEFASHVDKWISFAVKMGAERINLNVPFWSSQYTFPCHLLPVGGGSHLKSLCLGRCLLKPSLELVNRLNSLKSLELDTVKTLDERDMDVILSGCLNLESLILRECHPISTLCLRGHVRRLKWLLVASCYKIHTIELDSVSLERFEYKGRMARFNFYTRPPLAKVYLWISNTFYKEMGFMFGCLPRDFPLLENLTLCWHSNKLVTVPARIAAFSCLKHLNVILYLMSDFNLLSITYILNACPVLEKFHLSLHISSVDDDVREIDYSSQQYLQLKEVEINGFRDLWNAVQLAIHLLKNAIALERMIINQRSKRCDVGDKWEYREAPEYNVLTPTEIHGLLFKEKANPTTELLIM